MCSPEFSFNVTRSGQVYTSFGEQSHSKLSKDNSLNDDDILKISYDWTTRKYDFDTKPFTPKASHLKRIDETIKHHFGDWKKAKSSLRLICIKDNEVFFNLHHLLQGKAKQKWEDYIAPLEGICNITQDKEAPSILLKKFFALADKKKNRVAVWQ